MSNTPQRRSGCPVSCALDILGDKWTLLVIRDMAFLKKRYFKEFLASSEGIATNILADRLKKLEAENIVSKQPDPDNGRQMIYQLTEKGRALAPILLDLVYWVGTYDSTTVATPQLLRRIKEDRQALLEDLMG